MLQNRLPLVPADILKAHKVHESYDSRFKSAARLLQALWREDRGLPIGVHCSPKGKRRKLGSRLDPERQARSQLSDARDCQAGIS